MATFTPNTTINGTLTVDDSFSANNRPFRTFQHTHSSSNPETTTIVQQGNGWYTWSYGMNASPGSYPACPISYRCFCPVQRNGGSGRVWMDIYGSHRGLGNSYTEHHRVFFGGGSDSAHLEHYAVLNQRNTFRFAIVEWDGTVTEPSATADGGRYQYGWTIGQGNSTQPCIFRIGTTCGAGYSWRVDVRSDSTNFFPPFKGPTQLPGNTLPTYSDYQ